MDLSIRHPVEINVKAGKRSKGWRRACWLVAVVASILLALPTTLVLPWRWIDPPTSAFMMQARTGGLEIHQRWVDWHAISSQLPIAVVAAEDQSFPEHHGFDFESIRSALQEGDERQRGASTISQQVTKNLFLWSGHSWIRKGLEAYLTIFIEALWPKRRILEIYLNIAEFGPGVYGAQAAAGRFFDVSAAELNSRQAALLAAVLPNPRRFSAAKPSRYLQQRVGWILRQVDQLGGPPYLEGI